MREALSRTLTRASGDGELRAHLVVDPPALGRVEVAVRLTPVGLEATLRVDNETLRQMVQSQVDQLRGSLQAQGVAVAGLSVDLRDRGEDRSGHPKQGKVLRAQRASSGVGEAQEDEETLLPLEGRVDLRRGTLQWLA